MNGISFEDAYAAEATSPNRVDVACFVGFVPRRRTSSGSFVPPPDAIASWLALNQWVVTQSSLADHDLSNVPIPMTDWATFDRLFAWEARSPSKPDDGSTYLGAAVRAFFAEGGAKCYVVRVADPPPPLTSRGARDTAILRALAQLLPGYPNEVDASPVDDTTWRAIAVLYGLDDVSFVALPDLPDIVGVPWSAPPPSPAPPAGAEVFTECSEGDSPPAASVLVPQAGAPRCDEIGYRAWGRALTRVVSLLRGDTRLREVQLVAAVPIPAPDAATSIHAQSNLLGFLDDLGLLPRNLRATSDLTVDSAFLQLVYPWVRSSASKTLPEQLAPADGTLMGLLARNALLRGTYRSAGGGPLRDATELVPPLTRDELRVGAYDVRGYSLADRVSALGETPSGLCLISDVTTSRDPAHRAAPASRLVSAVLRAARHLGEDIAFDPAGPQLFRAVEREVSALMLGLWQDGALSGDVPSEAFDVRCDGTTTTADDLDQGRVFVEVRLQPALPIDAINVVLSLAADSSASAIVRGGMA